MKKIIFLIITSIIILSVTGCDLVKMGEALKMTIDTMDNNKKNPDNSPVSTDNPKTPANEKPLLEMIREDNKIINGDFTASNQWVDLYKKKLFPKTYANITETEWKNGTNFDYMVKSEYGVDLNNISVAFDNGDKVYLYVLELRERDADNKRHLINIYGTVNVIHDNILIYNMIKDDVRYSEMLKDENVLKNSYSEGLDEIDVSSLLPQYFGEWNFKYPVYTNKTTAELFFYHPVTQKTMKVIFDFNENKIISEDEVETTENEYKNLTAISTDNKLYTAYIDENQNLLAAENSTGELWLLYEATGEKDSDKKLAVPVFTYKNKIIYKIAVWEGSGGFGIYDAEKHENVIYNDTVNPINIQNGKLILGGNYYTTSAPYNMILDLDAEEYDIIYFKKFESIHDETIYAFNNKNYFISLTGGASQYTIKIINTTTGRLMNEYTYSSAFSYISDIIYSYDKIIIICASSAMAHNYYYTIDL